MHGAGMARALTEARSATSAREEEIIRLKAAAANAAAVAAERASAAQAASSAAAATAQAGVAVRRPLMPVQSAVKMQWLLLHHGYEHKGARLVGGSSCALCWHDALPIWGQLKLILIGTLVCAFQVCGAPVASGKARTA